MEDVYEILDKDWVQKFEQFSLDKYIDMNSKEVGLISRKMIKFLRHLGAQLLAATMPLSSKILQLSYALNAKKSIS